MFKSVKQGCPLDSRNAKVEKVAIFSFNLSKRGRPRNTWRRSLEAEIKFMGTEELVPAREGCTGQEAMERDC